MNTYTAFCQRLPGKGTIWIDTVEAENAIEAADLAQTACAADWSCAPEDVHVLGIALGDVNLLMWEDIDE